MKAGKNIFTTKYGWILFLAILVGINIIAAMFHGRIDLTKEKRYTLSRTTRELIKNLDDDVEIDVFLKGSFPSGFRQLASRTEEFLQLMKDRNGSKVHYRFISPRDKMPGTEILYGDSLVNMGAVPINLTVQLDAGQSSNIIFPVAIVHYKGQQTLVSLYPGASGRITPVEINSAEALMEYQFTNALNKMSRLKKPAIGYEVGHGEPTDHRSYDIVQTLKKDYEFNMFDITKFSVIPQAIDILMIVKPIESFSEDDKFKIDQYLMNGGKLLCFIDNLIAEQDSLAFKPETIAYDRNLNLTDIFFRYGFRINTDLVMDLQCDVIPLVVGGTMENPQFEFVHWNYFPLFAPTSNPVSNRGLGYISSRFANSIDTIQVQGVKKSILLSSSPNSRIISTPALISLNENRNAPEDEKFRQNNIPVSMLLEGSFNSLYRNRATQSQRDSLAAFGMQFKNESNPNAKIIVASDGDIVLNDIVPNTGPLPMGWNKYTFTEYENQGEGGKLFIPVANREFLLNCVEYLVNDPSISEIRNKDIVLRLLDTQKVKQQKTLWQVVNTLAVVLLVVFLGWIYQQVRRKKFA